MHFSSSHPHFGPSKGTSVDSPGQIKSIFGTFTVSSSFRNSYITVSLNWFIFIKNPLAGIRMPFWEKRRYPRLSVSTKNKF